MSLTFLMQRLNFQAVIPGLLRWMYGLVTPVGVGTAVIQAEVTIGGIVRSAELFMTVSLEKQGQPYTEEKLPRPGKI